MLYDESSNSNYWGIINVIAQVFTFPHWALVESRMGLLWHGTQASGPDRTKGGAHNQVNGGEMEAILHFTSL